MEKKVAFQAALAAADALRISGEWLAASNQYRQALDYEIGSPDALVGLGLCLEELGDPVDARQAFLNCLTYHPETAFAHHRLGWLSYQQKKFVDALTYYQQAAYFAPKWHEPFYHAAVCCHELRRYQEAIALYQRALECKADLPSIWYHYAKALKDAGQLDEALPAYQQAIRLKPDYDEALYSLGLLYFLRGDWSAGWEGYELRFQGSDRAASEHRPVSTLPIWGGESLPDDSGLVVYSEQGMGDSIMCFRYVDLLKKNFRRIKFSVHALLVTLFQGNAGADIEVVPRVSSPIDETGYTHQVPMLSLPSLFRTTPENVPPAPYLKPDSEKTAYWQTKLLGDARLKVGLVWKGGKLTYAPARDMAFEHLLPILRRTDIHWFSLQKDDSPPTDAPLTDWMNETSDFNDTAALIANLDLVIAVDTAVAHLAGALGKPVWLLNRFESEWRWMRGRATTPWYPTMRIFSQPSPGDWDSVIADVDDALLLCYPPAPDKLDKCVNEIIFQEDTEIITTALKNRQVNQMKTFLHVGCGPKSKDQTTRTFDGDDWRELRLDIDAGVKPDIIGTMTDMSAVADASVDAIFSSHNIEHLYPHEVPLALKEFLRVLKPDGFAVITCPDLQSVCALIADDKLTDAAYTAPAGPIAPLDILYGHRPPMARGNLYMAHRCGFTRKVLHATLQSEGFPVVATLARGRAPFFDLWAVASKSNRTEDEMRALAEQHLPI